MIERRARRPTAGLIHVVRPGLLTTVQDLGRPGFQRWGMPPGGAMDPLALRLANRLVGNEDGAACLEVTLQGPELLFETPTLLALTGADPMAWLDGQAVPPWTAVAVAAGMRLVVGPLRSGARSYLAVAGGLDVPLVLGSRSTHLGSQTGGLQGRAVVAGDVLRSGRVARRGRPGYTLPSDVIPQYGSVLRVLPGPHPAAFGEAAWATLTAHPYVVSPESDRVGYRLQGPLVPHGEADELLSEAVPLGAVQVPADGHPILLMADHPTTGGYPVLAVLAAVDVPQAGQCRPGEAIRFMPVELMEARRLARAQAQRVARVAVNGQ